MSGPVLYTPGNASRFLNTRQINKGFWGRPQWHMLHVLAASYEPSPMNKRAFLAYVYSLTRLLPCNACRQNLAKNLKILPPEDYLNSKEGAFLWSYQLHDIVNAELGKTSPKYSAVKYYYFTQLGENCSDCESPK